jgi:predicted RNA-binding protein Jag
MEQFLSDLYNLNIPIEPGNEGDDARSATQQAIAAVLNGERYVDMPPANPVIRRIQHEMARAADLVSHSYGKEPRRYVRIFRD